MSRVITVEYFDTTAKKLATINTSTLSRAFSVARMQSRRVSDAHVTIEREKADSRTTYWFINGFAIEVTITTGDFENFKRVTEAFEEF